MPSSSTAPEGPGSVSGAPNLPGDGLPSDLREGYAEIGDQRLHYVEAGDGPLIVLLHGFPEFWYGWRLQIQPLAAAGFRVVAPDLRGYNLSSKPDDVAAYDTGPPPSARSPAAPRAPSPSSFTTTARNSPDARASPSPDPARGFLASTGPGLAPFL